MRIRSTVKIATFITIIVVLIYGAFDLYLGRAHGIKEQDLQRVTDLRSTFDQLRDITTDYMLHRTERAKQQWWTVQGEILQRLNTPDFQAFQREYLLLDLEDRLKLMGDAFTRLTITIEKTGLSAPEVEANREFRNRLITQIMLTSHEIVTSLIKITEEINDDRISLIDQENLLDVIALLILGLLIVVYSLFLSRSVVQPILQLHEDAEIIGRGNLDHRVATNGSGEIKELSQAFNEMTANLMKVTVSRDELAKEVKERRQAQEALRGSEERFRAFMDNSPTVAWAKDEAGQYVYTSKTLQSQFGVKLEDWQGKTDFELWPQEIAEEFRKNDLAVLTGGQAIDVIEQAIKPDGSRSYWWNFKFPFFDAGGVRYVGGIGVDVTERLRAEEALRESEERFRQSFENANIGMALVGIDGRYLRVNIALSEMLGYSREELEHMGVPDLTYPDDLKLSKDFRLRSMRGEISSAQLEKRKVHRNGTIVWVHLTSSLLRDSQGKPLYFVSQLQDITARKRAEEALLQAHQELEQRVQERTRELRLAVEQLQREVEDRQQAEEALRESEQKLRYLASQILTAQELERKRISMDLHEGLGQSMTALKMYLRAIQRNLPIEMTEIREDFEGSQKLLKAMVEEVRRISRGLSPAILENLGLTAAFKRLLAEFSKIYGVAIKVNADDIQNLFSPQTEVNLFRIFQESLNNIAKHAQATQVSLTIAKQDGRVHFCIRDNGVGFDLDNILRKELISKGMGLAAMEERLRMIGAQLNISSQKGTGTEISFSIPIDAACLIKS